MKRFTNILFVKSEDNNETALTHALILAKRNNASLTILHTPEEIPDISAFGLPNESIRQAKRVALVVEQEELDHLVDAHNGGVEVKTNVIEGRPFLTIIREVLRHEYDLVIKSAERNEGRVSRLFSTTDMHLLRKCPCAVWLVNPERPQAIKRIVAAVDFDDPGEKGENDALNKQILEMALTLAHRRKTELHIVHAWQATAEQILSSTRSALPEGEVEKYIAEVKASRERHLAILMEQAKNWVGSDLFEAVKPKNHVIKGRAYQVIAEQTRSLEADLLVMGTVGRVGITGFFIGNTAESILNWIDCSVLAVKPEGFVSPVELPGD